MAVQKRDLVALVERGGLVVEGPETIDELAEALGYLVMRQAFVLTPAEVKQMQETFDQAMSERPDGEAA